MTASRLFSEPTGLDALDQVYSFLYWITLDRRQADRLSLSAMTCGGPPSPPNAHTINVNQVMLQRAYTAWLQTIRAGEIGAQHRQLGNRADLSYGRALRLGTPSSESLSAVLPELPAAGRALLWLWSVAECPEAEVAQITGLDPNEAPRLLRGTIEWVESACQHRVRQRAEKAAQTGWGRAGWLGPGLQRHPT
ncbi:MAG: hypothetical protein AAF333_08195 [Planctomycetota bacterium]